MDSVLGMSGFKDIEHLEECRDRLTEYYLEIHSFEVAEKKVNYEISQAKKGERSQLIKEFLQGLPLGSKFKQEYESKRGVLLPVFEAYLEHKLYRDKETRERTQERVFWLKKDSTRLKSAWSECKRLIDIEKPRLLQAIELGQNPVALKIPEWIIDAFRPEIPIEQVAETAEVLGAIADKYNSQVDQNNHKYLESVQQGILPKEDKDSGLYKLKKAIGLPCRDKVSSVEEQIDLLLCDQRSRAEGLQLAEQNNVPLILNTLGEAVAVDYQKIEYFESLARREAADELMDKVVADKKTLDLAELLPNTPKAKLVLLQSEIEEITALLHDPITREVGVKKAKTQNFPILYSDEGIAIAIDKQSMREDGDYQFSSKEPVDKTNYAAHKIYQPEKIEKTKFDWAAAKKRLRNKF